jgi:gamma-glutamyltranspeptidase/glutathione hydrolase
MMAPTLLHGDDGMVTALGSGGSNRIRTALFQLIVRLATGERDLEAAIRAPRIHGERGRVDFEDFFEREDEREALLRVAEDVHPWAERNLFFGGVHVARRDAKGGLSAAGDPRRAGAAIIA